MSNTENDQISKTYGQDFYEGHERYVHHYDLVADLLYSLAKPKTALDLGCGNAYILSRLATLGTEVQGIDGSDNAATAANVPVEIRDLSQKQEFERSYDLIISTEVAEHLPEESADNFVYSIANHTDVIFFTAGQPGQDGLGHINCQSKSYWEKKFAERGFQRRPLFELVANIAMYPITMERGWLRNNFQILTRPPGTLRNSVLFKLPYYLARAVYWYTRFHTGK